MGSLRDKILAADDLPREKVQTDEWAPFGAPFVYVRGLSAKDVEVWQRSITVPGPDGNRKPNPKLTDGTARFLVRVVVDEEGQPIFEDSDIAELSQKSAAVLLRLATVGFRLSGVTSDEDEANPSKGDQEEQASSDSP